MFNLVSIVISAKSFRYEFLILFLKQSFKGYLRYKTIFCDKVALDV